MFYHPDTINTTLALSDFKYEEVWINTEDNVKINGLFIKSKSEAIATILFLHGNAGNLSGWKTTLETLVKNGFNVFIIDYQGFGKSEGKPKHKNLFKDSEAALFYMKKRNDTAKTKIIVLGTSIGGHLAVSLTDKHQDKIDALVIEGAFTTHNEIATAIVPWLFKPFVKILVRSKFKAKKHIKNVKIPKMIVHSAEDVVIPFRMGKKLHELAAEPKTFWEIKGKHIHGLKLYPDEYVQRLKELVK
ncbi:MAG: hypothetical protein A2275_18360 [Bacteroidetes bacterium RIFOXYA12_FULL_35_11]|nr:MAG: hypothetical protein A2X01_15090 [Bacteroidetes bacterium GWF2_35_48]OFY82734.1 MAG: hypothetical protein A2275_18360 [Bacteroidetes bacterium RIFOXYA12_FULL_35_11]OFY96960.1 MAG: hypothetical protein A2491_10435 [Bacteroidetes bacterium RIFOXYC12_FULL_35_7]